MNPNPNAKPVTVKMSAWNTSEYRGPGELAAMAPGLLADALFYRPLGAEPSKDLKGWSQVGTADITVHLDSADTMVSNMVSALRTQATQVLAEAQAKATDLERKAQELLALPMSPPTPGAAPPASFLDNDDGLPF